MSEQARELLNQSIRAGAVAVLTLSAAAGSRERVIIRLVPPGDSPEGRAIAADVQEGPAGLIDELVRSATPLRVAIKIKPWAGIAFQTILLSQQRRLLGRRVTLQMPREVAIDQRRRAPRERVPQEIRVQARFSARKGATATAEVAADVWDLSATGVCLWCRADELPPRIEPGDMLDVILAYNGQEQSLTARFRHRYPMTNGGVRLGLEFDPTTGTPPRLASSPDVLRPLIEVLAQLRVRRAYEQFAARTLGLAG